MKIPKLIIPALAVGVFCGIFLHYQKSKRESNLKPIVLAKSGNVKATSSPRAFHIPEWDKALSKADGIPVEDSDTFEGLVRKDISVSKSTADSAELVQIASALVPKLLRYVGTGQDERFDRVLQEKQIAYQIPVSRAIAKIRQQTLDFDWAKLANNQILITPASADSKDLGDNTFAADAFREAFPDVTQIAQIEFDVIFPSGNSSHEVFFLGSNNSGQYFWINAYKSSCTITVPKQVGV